MYDYDFSFVIPVYNSEKYLKKCINSVLNQRYDLSRIQIILINDGSTDKSLKICKKYESENIVVVNKINEGVSKARNVGIKKAKGKYISFLDSDDYVSDNYCSEIFDFFEKNYDYIDIVTFPLVNFNGNKKRVHFRYASLYSNENKIYDVKEASYVIQTTINVCIKNRFNENELFDESMKFSEDEEFVTRNIMFKEKIGYCSKCNYFYRKNNNESATKKYKVTEKEFDLFIKYYSELLSKYKNSIYVKNLFLNSLRWKIGESKLLPSKNEKYIDKIAIVLKKVDISDIMNLNFLSLRIKLSILNLKKIDYKMFVEKNKITISVKDKKYYINNPINIDVVELQYDSCPVIICISDFQLNGFETEKIYPYREQLIDTYIYMSKFYAKNNVLDFSDLGFNFNIRLKVKNYKLKYRISKQDSKIIIKENNLFDVLKIIIKKILKI